MCGRVEAFDLCPFQRVPKTELAGVVVGEARRMHTFQRGSKRPGLCLRWNRIMLFSIVRCSRYEGPIHMSRGIDGSGDLQPRQKRGNQDARRCDMSCFGETNTGCCRRQALFGGPPLLYYCCGSACFLGTHWGTSAVDRFLYHLHMNDICSGRSDSPWEKRGARVQSRVRVSLYPFY